MDSFFHPWFTTTNLSYRFPIFETSATALCGTTGIVLKNWAQQDLQLMSGDPPFEYEDFKQLKAKILTGVSAESLPDACKKSEPCRNLVVDPSLSRCLVLMFLFILTPAAPSSWRKLALDYQAAKLPPIHCIGVSFEPIQHFWRKKAGRSWCCKGPPRGRVASHLNFQKWSEPRVFLTANPSGTPVAWGGNSRCHGFVPRWQIKDLKPNKLQCGTAMCGPIVVKVGL